MTKSKIYLGLGVLLSGFGTLLSFLNVGEGRALAAVDESKTSEQKISGNSSTSARATRPSAALTVDTDGGLEWIYNKPLKLVYEKDSQVLQRSFLVRNVSKYPVEISFSEMPEHGGEKTKTIKVTERSNELSNNKLTLSDNSSYKELTFMVGSKACDVSPPKFGVIELQKPDDCNLRTGTVLATIKSWKTIEKIDQQTKEKKEVKEEVHHSKLIDWNASIPQSDELKDDVVTEPFYWAGGIVIIALVVGCLKKWPWSEIHIGTLNWDFLKSWVSNTALFGTLLTGGIGLVGFPSSPIFFSKSVYLFIGIWAAFLVALGHQIYNGFGWGKAGQITGNRVLVFLIGQFFVLWAAFMQLRAARVLVAELTLAQVLSSSVEYVIGFTFGFVFVLLVSYAVYSLVRAIWEPAPTPAPGAPDSFVDSRTWPML